MTLSNAGVKVINLLLAFIGLTGTNVFLIMEGQAAPSSQYMFALVYCYYSIIFYIPVSWYMVGNRLWPALRILLNIKYSGLLGLLWTINYVFILVANPFVAVGEQVILTQMQTVLVWAINTLMFRLVLRPWKHLCVLVAIVAGCVALANVNNAFTPAIPIGTTRQLLLSLVFVINAFANGLSNVFLEGQYQVFWEEDQGAAAPRGRHHTPGSLWKYLLTCCAWSTAETAGEGMPLVNHPAVNEGVIDLAPAAAHEAREARIARARNQRSALLNLTQIEFAIVINIAYNFWSIVFWLPFFWVGILPNQGDIFHIDFLSSGSLYFLLMSLSTYVYTIGVNVLISFESSLYAAIIQQVPPILSTLILSRKFMGVYYQAAAPLDWAMVALSSGAGLLYALQDDKQNTDSVKRSIFSSIYRD